MDVIGDRNEFAITTLVTVGPVAVLEAIIIVVGVLDEDSDLGNIVVPLADFFTTIIRLPSAVSPPDFKRPCDFSFSIV